MRLDKFLWSIRRFKTRSLATTAITKNGVSLNGEGVKASKTVKIGDQITIRKGGVNYSIKVIGIPRSRVGAKLVEEYILDTTSAEELEKREFMLMMHKLGRGRGTGRPTKKDRRDLDEFIDFDEWDDDELIE